MGICKHPLCPNGCRLAGGHLFLIARTSGFTLLFGPQTLPTYNSAFMNPTFEKKVLINADPATVWEALTKPAQMIQWMGEPEMQLAIKTNWQVSSKLEHGYTKKESSAKEGSGKKVCHG